MLHRRATQALAIRAENNTHERLVLTAVRGVRIEKVDVIRESSSLAPSVSRL